MFVKIYGWQGEDDNKFKRETAIIFRKTFRTVCEAICCGSQLESHLHRCHFPSRILNYVWPRRSHIWSGRKTQWNGRKHGRPDFNKEEASRNKTEVGGTRSRRSETGLTKEWSSASLQQCSLQSNVLGFNYFFKARHFARMPRPHRDKNQRVMLKQLIVRCASHWLDNQPSS